MSDGCSAPRFAQVADWALRRACEVAREACDRHDERYYRGGTTDAKLAADVVLCAAVQDALLRAGESEATAEGAAAAFFRGLQTRIAFDHWHFPAGIAREPQET